MVAAALAHRDSLSDQPGSSTDDRLQAVLTGVAERGTGAGSGELSPELAAVVDLALAEHDLLDVLSWLVEDTRERERHGSYYTESDAAAFLVRTCVAGALLDRLGPLLGPTPWSLLHADGGDLLRLNARPCPLPGEPPLQAEGRLQDRWRQLEHLASGTVSCASDALASGVALDRLLLRAVGERPTQDTSLWEALDGFLVMDCSAGSGQLLLPAAQLLLELYEHVTVPAGSDVQERLTKHLFAADRDRVALHGAALRLAVVLTRSPLAEDRQMTVVEGLALLGRRTCALDLLTQARHVTPDEMAAALPRADVVVGNPPYLRNREGQRLDPGWSTREVPDVCGLFVEQATASCRPGAWTGFVLPLSVQSTRNYVTVRDLLRSSFHHVAVAAFSRRPSSLFPNAGVRTAMVLSLGRLEQPGQPTGRVLTTAAQRWTPPFRPYLFDSLVFRPLPDVLVAAEGWSRLPNDPLAEVFARLRTSHPAGIGSVVASDSGPWAVGFRGNALYELTAFTHAEMLHVEVDGWREPQSMMRWLPTRNEEDQDALLAVLLSSFALVWWHCHGDDLNVTRRTLASIPIDISALAASDRAALAGLGRRLRTELPQVRTLVRYGGRQVEGYAIRALRETTDAVDQFLASAFGYAEALPALAAAYEGVTRGLPPPPPAGGAPEPRRERR